MPTISFVIPAYNEAALIGRTLIAIEESIRVLGESAETIVVDDASTDETATIASKHGARVIPVHHRQIAATRNAGAKEAGGGLIVFVDADTVVDADVVRAALAAIRDGAVGGGCRIRFTGRLPLYGRVLAALALPLYRWAGLAAGCFLFCTRDAFIAVGGFDETLFAAEEATMSRALRAQGRFVILRESVLTSGRKLRTHGGRETASLLLGMIAKGPKALRQRAGLELWYGDRRADREGEA